MSSDAEDPLGMQRLFEQQLSGDSLALSASAGSDTPSHWLIVLQLSLRCLTKWLQASGGQHLVGLQTEHMDAMLYLIAQQGSAPSAQPSTEQPPSATDKATLGPSSETDTHRAAMDLLRDLGDALLALLQTEDMSWACNHVAHRVLIGPCALSSSSMSHSSRVAVMQLGATCLMRQVQSCLAGRADCQLAVDVWLEFAASVPWMNPGVLEPSALSQVAQPRCVLAALLCFSLRILQLHCQAKLDLLVRYKALDLEVAVF